MEEIIRLIKENCDYYIKSLRKCEKAFMLVRATKRYEVGDYHELTHDLTFRKPKSMDIKIHDSINKKFEPIFGWKIRNGLFCYGYNIIIEPPRDLGYGPFYILFPKGNFKFVYHPKIFDLYEYMIAPSNKDNANEVIENLDFKYENLAEALIPGKETDGLSNEISLKTENYYLVNMKFKDAIIKMIWD